MLRSLPNYTLDRPILHSSEATLYAGRRDSDGAAVLVKTAETGSDRQAALARLRHEFQLLRELDVPGAPRPIALEIYPGGRALILEAVAGEPLSDLLRRGRFDVRTALAVGVALARVLAGVHGRGVIYKRLSPQQILCDLAGPAVCLIDFSCASWLSQELGRAASLAGEVSDFAYISPEQTGRMNRTLDTRSDLYSFGLILYELFAGASPFARLTDALTLIHAHIARVPVPLREVAPEVPEMLERIVHRLLAKTAEERYQTTSGVLRDLERCVQALERGESVGEFSLGSHDRDGKLRLPQRLYGRDAEHAVLLAAFDRVHAGAAELMLVSGYSGIGKSVLVREVNRPIAERGGVFVAGKFDQFNRSVPYAALGQAFRELTHLLLCESPGALASWQTRILQALGPGGKLITDLVPELAVIIGPQPDLGPLGPAEAQHRLELTLRRFVRAISGPEHPLVLFLDDLQWIDPASLNLIHALLTDGEQSHLLIVGAYRDNEVGSAHLLTAALDTLRKSSVTLVELTLQPLALASVTSLLADTLDQPSKEVDALARSLHGKTQGNPFFLGQYLAELVGDRTLWFDRGAQRWRWDVQGVESRVVAENVVALVMAKLRRLPATTQQVVTLAAAIGHQFDAATLATISGMSVTDTFAALWPALETSVALPVGENYRFLVRRADDDSDAAELRPQDVWFKFLHDRIQQAAYALTPESQLPDLHLRIGHLLLERHGGPEGLRPPALFEVARHLDRGAEHISEPGERMMLARLDLAAGRHAKAAAAYESATAFFSVGASLLTPAHWDSEYDLAFALHSEHAACEYLSGRPDAAEALLEALIPRARTDFHYAELCTLRAQLHATQGRVGDGIASSLKGLERLGIALPTDPEAQQAVFMEELAAASANLGGRSVAELLDAPVIDDPRIELAVTILSDLVPACSYAAPGLYGPVLMKGVNLSLKHGHNRVSAFGYVTYGFLLVAMLGQYELGHEFGRLALALNERFQNTHLTCQIHVCLGMWLPHTRPLREALEHSRIGYRAGLESGDVNFLCFGCYTVMLFRFALGDELLAVGVELEQFIEIADRSGERLAAMSMAVFKQAIASLQDETRGPGLGSDDFDEERFRAEQEVKGPSPLLFRYYLLKEMLHYLFGDHYRALEEGERAERMIGTMAGMHESTMHVFYLGLTLLSLSRTASGELRQAYAERIARCQDTLSGWAKHSPENFAHRAGLLRAEMADLAGDAEAPRLYEHAIEAAERSGFVSDLALANELAALHHLGRGRREAAGPLLHAARRGYARWGANAKVALLDQKHRALLFPDGPPQERYIDENEPVVLGHHADSSFDAMTVLKVAQALAGEIVLTRLIEQIMTTVTTRAGAQRGALILEQDGKLMIEAIITHDPDVVRVDVREPLEESQLLATSIVRYVAHTRETVVLGDASRVERFGSDRYILAHRPKSVLCLALTHRGRLIGLIYLENNLAANVFTVEQVDLIRMLAAHAAISVQNALLYANVERMTAELRASNAELSEVNRRLQSELQERGRAERERTLLQEEVIAVQNARLAELSTPLIPISDQIMVMPIIGTVDDDRASRLVEAALEGAHGSRAAVVILDITGLKQIDHAAAASLLRTARALRLLGSAVVITGIRADIARTLIDIGVDLTGVVTRGTLQDGIAHAMQLVGDGKNRRR